MGEDLRARGAREAQPVQERLLGQSARQRGEEDRGQDHWKEGRSMQEAAKGSQGGSPGVHKGQRAPGPWPHPLRVHGVVLLARSPVLEKLPQILTPGLNFSRVSAQKKKKKKKKKVLALIPLL